MLTWQVILCVVMGSPSIMSHQSLLLTSPCGKRPSVFRVSKSCSLSFAGTPCAGKRTVALPVDCVWNVMAHAQKPDFVFRRNGRVHLNRQGRQSSRLLAAEVCASAVVMVVMLDKPCSEEVWRVLATHSIRQLPLHFPPVRHRVPSRFNWTLPATSGCSWC
jgi:hypothetical protein